MQIEEQDECLSSDHVAGLIRREIRPYFERLGEFPSTPALESSSLFARLRPIYRAVMETVHSGRFAKPTTARRSSYRVIAWNVERGKELDGQVEILRTNEYLRDADVMLLTETDVGMARSGNLDVAQTLAGKLGYDYAFAPCYLSLVKGSGTERDIGGENDLGMHGNAILSRYPMRDIRRIPLTNGIDKLASREKRLGSQAALSATIEFPGEPVAVACVHLDANSTQRHRMEQMRDVMNAIPSGARSLVGGDWNTTTFNSSTAFHAIMGYWLRVLMGPNRVIANHFLHPYRRFEKELFDLLESRGFDFRECNRIGDYSIFYHVDDLAQYKGLAEWVPLWCFSFIRWALRDVGGGCPLMIDWFASRGLTCRNPVVLHEVNRGPRGKLSDHDAIGVEITLG